MIYILLLLSWGLLVLILASASYYYYYYFTTLSTNGVPSIGSFSHDLLLLKSYLENYESIDGKTIVDLGCGEGKVVRYFLKHWSPKHAYGYDNNRFSIRFWRAINKLWGIQNISLIEHDFMENPEKINRERVDIVYVYLFPHLMEKVEKIMRKHANRGTLLICSRFFLPKKTSLTLKNSIMKEKATRYKVYIKN